MPALIHRDGVPRTARYGSSITGCSATSRGPILYTVCTLLVLVQFWAGVAGFAAMVALYLVPPPPAPSSRVSS